MLRLFHLEDWLSSGSAPAQDTSTLYAPGHDEGERLHLHVITRNISFFQRNTSDTLKKKANHPMKKIPQTQIRQERGQKKKDDQWGFLYKL